MQHSRTPATETGVREDEPTKSAHGRRTAMAVAVAVGIAVAAAAAILAACAEPAGAEDLVGGIADTTAPVQVSIPDTTLPTIPDVPVSTVPAPTAPAVPGVPVPTSPAAGPRTPTGRTDVTPDPAGATGAAGAERGTPPADPLRTQSPSPRSTSPRTSVVQDKPRRLLPTSVEGRPLPARLSRAVLQTAQDLGFPLGLAAAIVVFLVLHGRLDQHDPRMAGTGGTPDDESLGFS